MSAPLSDLFSDFQSSSDGQESLRGDYRVGLEYGLIEQWFHSHIYTTWLVLTSKEL
jgi:hypothetical protein